MNSFKWINNPEKGIFLERPNRFTAIVKINSNVERVYLPDPGRLKELMLKGSEVIVEKRRETGKTNYDLLLIKTQKFSDRKPLFVSVDSRLSNKFFAFGIKNELFKDFKKIDFKAEPKINNGRLDFLLYENPLHYIEIKSVNLVDSKGIARFPDAPTKRGSRHLNELIKLKAEGYRTTIIFMVNREDATEFSPFSEMDPLFSNTLKEVNKAGVNIIALKNKSGITIKHLNRIPVNLNPDPFPGYWPLKN